MIPTLELTEEEVLECLQKILKNAVVVLHTVREYRADNPPLAVSYLCPLSTFHFSLFYLICVLSDFIPSPDLVDFFVCRNWGIILLI
jgi:hypothetical protein